ncbi:MAG: hypothetical protein ACTHU0_33675 [Kofleriaceae bacterium]
MTEPRLHRRIWIGLVLIGLVLAIAVIAVVVTRSWIPRTTTLPQPAGSR